jgi:hypothetical protein
MIIPISGPINKSVELKFWLTPWLTSWLTTRLTVWLTPWLTKWLTTSQAGQSIDRPVINLHSFTFYQLNLLDNLIPDQLISFMIIHDYSSQFV